MANPFDYKLSIYDELYDDDVLHMKKYLPMLVEKCKTLGKTSKGKNYYQLRIPLFLLGSLKLEASLTPGASEREAFKTILEFLNESSGKEFVTSQDEDVHQIPRDGEGQNESNDAWYAQC